jgi:hypothetical protein
METVSRHVCGIAAAASRSGVNVRMNRPHVCALGVECVANGVTLFREATLGGAAMPHFLLDIEGGNAALYG